MDRGDGVNGLLMLHHLSPWPALVQAGQMFSALAWLSVSHHYVPSTIRVLRGRSTNGWDGAGCWAWAMGMVQSGFTARWLILGGGDVHAMTLISLVLWAPLYLLNGAVALGILHTWRDADYIAGMRRARAGLALWGCVLALCIGASLWTV